MFSVYLYYLLTVHGFTGAKYRSRIIDLQLYTHHSSTLTVLANVPNIDWYESECRHPEDKDYICQDVASLKHLREILLDPLSLVAKLLLNLSTTMSVVKKIYC
jgi:hypothetical protein